MASYVLAKPFTAPILQVKQQDFEVRVASLADELARAKLEKSEAEGKNAMLEKMVELHKEVGSSPLEYALCYLQAAACSSSVLHKGSFGSST